MSLSKEQIAAFAQNVVQMMDGVTTVADVRGISREQLEAVYHVAYTYYNSGKFDDAETLFKFLCMVEHTDHKYWTALGAVRHAKKDYAKAIEAYAQAALLNASDPKPHLYAAECAMLVGNFDMADSGCVSVLALCPAGVGKNDVYRAKAEKLQSVIKALREKAEGGK